jgi:mandelate racemase
MVDFNQALIFSDAMTYALTLDQEGVYWIEEPTRQDDNRHMVALLKRLERPIQRR